MRAIVFQGLRQVSIEDRPIPTIQDTKDIIVKVRYTAVCGRYESNMHIMFLMNKLVSWGTWR
jgi:threonine dehydrogenase-like Zn-dependent dehydrogenase